MAMVKNVSGANLEPLIKNRAICLNTSENVRCQTACEHEKDCSERLPICISSSKNK